MAYQRGDYVTKAEFAAEVLDPALARIAVADDLALPEVVHAGVALASYAPLETLYVDESGREERMRDGLHIVTSVRGVLETGLAIVDAEMDNPNLHARNIAILEELGRFNIPPIIPDAANLRTEVHLGVLGSAMGGFSIVNSTEARGDLLAIARTRLESAQRSSQDARTSASSDRVVQRANAAKLRTYDRLVKRGNRAVYGRMQARRIGKLVTA